MKRFFFTAALACFYFTASAQTENPDAPITPMESTGMTVDEQARYMMNDLQLNEGQYIQFKNILKDRQAQVDQINKQYSNDPQMRQQKLNEIDTNADQQLGQFLSDEQMSTYMELQGRSATETRFMADDVNSEEIKIKSESDEMKIKTDDSKYKVKEGKMKVETPEGEMKIKNDKIRPDGSQRMKHDTKKAK